MECVAYVSFDSPKCSSSGTLRKDKKTGVREHRCPPLMRVLRVLPWNVLEISYSIYRGQSCRIPEEALGYTELPSLSCR